MSQKDANQLVRDLRRYFTEAGTGHTLERRGGHWHIINATGNSVARFASTPSEHRFRNNTITDLRRRGIVPPGWRG